MFYSGTVRHRGNKRQGQAQQETKSSIDGEDMRIKQLTEAVLYDFLPAALNVMLPHCTDLQQELDADRCRVRVCLQHVGREGQGRPGTGNLRANARHGYQGSRLQVHLRGLAAPWGSAPFIPQAFTPNIHMTPSCCRRLRAQLCQCQL